MDRSFNATTLNILNHVDPKVSIYPNPNNKVFNIQSSSNIESIEILDIIGNTIKSLNSQSNLFQVNIEEKPSGIYFIKLNYQDGNYIIKRIICK